MHVKLCHANSSCWFLNVIKPCTCTVYFNISVAFAHMQSNASEMNVNLMDIIFRNFRAIPQTSSGKCFITVGLKTDGLSVPSPCPGSSSWAGKWLKKAGATLSWPAPFTGSNSQMPGRCQRPCSQWQRGQ